MHSQISNIAYNDNAHLISSSSNQHSILNGRLDNVLLNSFPDNTLQQEEDLGNFGGDDSEPEDDEELDLREFDELEEDDETW